MGYAFGTVKARLHKLGLNDMLLNCSFLITDPIFRGIYHGKQAHQGN